MNRTKIVPWACAAPGATGSQGPRSRAVLLICAALCFGAVAVHSEPAPAPEGGACQAEEQKLCPDMKPGSEELKACMKAHKDELSEACRKAMQGPKRARKRLQPRAPAACKADIQRYCPNLKVGSNELMNCMLENQDRLSKACKRTMRNRMLGLGTGAAQPTTASPAESPQGTPEPK